MFLSLRLRIMMSVCLMYLFFLEKGIFQELKDESYFRLVSVAFGGVQWPHEQDFSKDTLYLLSFPEDI
jgi:hypothetical protein